MKSILSGVLTRESRRGAESNGVSTADRMTIGEDADVHQLYQLQHDLTVPQVFYALEVDQLCEVFFRARTALTKTDNGLLYSIVDKAVRGSFSILETMSA